MGGRSYHQENPKRQNNFSVGLPAEILVCVVTKYINFVEDEWKKGGKNNKNAIGTLQLSLQVLITTMYCLAELSQLSAHGN